MVYGLILILIWYSAFTVLLLAGWRKTIAMTPAVSARSRHFVSVVIAARNEGKTIDRLLHDLALQQLDTFEVIVIDDHSEDTTETEVRQMTTVDKRFRYAKATGHGKKSALTQGVALARGAIIVTTDADCRVHDQWLASLVGYFADPSVKMVSGGVVISQQSFFSVLQSIEFVSLIGSGAATIGLGIPTMCNGANLAFTRSAFQQVKGYEGNEQVASGDDEFLMRKIVKAYPGSLAFSNSKQAIVTTQPAVTLWDFTRQRLRWAGKWRHNTSWYTLMIALFVMLVQGASLLSLVLIIQQHSQWRWAVVYLLLKAVMEATFLRRVSKDMHVSWNWLAFTVLQIAYPVYVVLMGLLSAVVPNTWKGRKV